MPLANLGSAAPPKSNTITTATIINSGAPKFISHNLPSGTNRVSSGRAISHIPALSARQRFYLSYPGGVVLEAVVNISEGRDPLALDAMARACGPWLIDIHTDIDHNRSVFTLADIDPQQVLQATQALADAAASKIDLRNHEGVHPKFGAIDVVPFIPLDDTTHLEAEQIAWKFANWLAEEHRVPIFFYDNADPNKRSLPQIRREAFTDRVPDIGPSQSNPRLGACAVGIREPLVAVNFLLDSINSEAAQKIARVIRESNGGLPGVRALAFHLDSQQCSQVSLNITDLTKTSTEQAYEQVEELAREHGVRINHIELVGLVPQAELEKWRPEFQKRCGITQTQTIEARIAKTHKRG